MKDLKPELIFWFVLLVILLNYPVLGWFNKWEILPGLPSIYLYFFCVWLLFIFVFYRISRKMGLSEIKPTEDE